MKEHHCVDLAIETHNLIVNRSRVRHKFKYPGLNCSALSHGKTPGLFFYEIMRVGFKGFYVYLDLV